MSKKPLYEEVARHATELLINKANGKFSEQMRRKFPGISNYMLRKSLGDAKILAALKQYIREEGE
jgi:hypothetical protein